MKNFYWLLLFATALATMANSAVAAEGQSAAEQKPGELVDDNVGIVDQVVSASFDVSQAFMLFERSRGSVQQYSAGIYPLAEGAGGSGVKYLLGTKVKLGGLQSADAVSRYTFFMLGQDGLFAATPVRSTSLKELWGNSKSLEELARDSRQLKLELSQQSSQVEALESELAVLREQASEVAGVDEIVDLKMELAKIQSFGSEAAEEEERLKALVNYGRELADPADVDQWRKTLSVHLREAAEATAMADRLNSRRKEAAQAALKERLIMIKETKGVDVEQLARQALELRRRRKELENRMNLRSSDAGQDF